MTNDDGTPFDERFGEGSMLENGGDVVEALEECYGMVWALAVAAVARQTGRPATRAEALEVIDRAQKASDTGAALGRTLR
jgi:mannose/cellobiose epimerase-like protein (N-acyl-D-glucosamine 2-epimerase family)